MPTPAEKANHKVFCRYCGMKLIKRLTATSFGSIFVKNQDAVLCPYCDKVSE